MLFPFTLFLDNDPLQVCITRRFLVFWLFPFIPSAVCCVRVIAGISVALLRSPVAITPIIFGSGEMLNVKLNVHQGFHLRLFSFPYNAITPQQVIRRYHKVQGRYGGTGTVPSVFLPVLRISCQIKGNFQAFSPLFFKNRITSWQ